MRKRMDRYINDAMQAFAVWYVKENPDWLGKERDCVNIFATRFLSAGIETGAAIEDPGQIRIECAVRQPGDKEKFPSPSATKDLVIWDDPLKTTWDPAWSPQHEPRAIMEWKTSRSGRAPKIFDAHDVEWLTEFTLEHPNAFGFLVSTHATEGNRRCMWAMVRKGIVGRSKVVQTEQPG